MNWIFAPFAFLNLISSLSSRTKDTFIGIKFMFQLDCKKTVWESDSYVILTWCRNLAQCQWLWPWLALPDQIQLGPWLPRLYHTTALCDHIMCATQTVAAAMYHDCCHKPLLSSTTCISPLWFWCICKIETDQDAFNLRLQISCGSSLHSLGLTSYPFAPPLISPQLFHVAEKPDKYSIFYGNIDPSTCNLVPFAGQVQVQTTSSLHCPRIETWTRSLGQKIIPWRLCQHDLGS